MRFYVGWPACSPDCGRWRDRAPTDHPAGTDGVTDEYRIELTARWDETGAELFRRSAEKLRAYHVFPTGLMRYRVCTKDGQVRVGSVIVQRVRIGIIVIEAAVRVLDTWSVNKGDFEEAGFSYVTLAGHPERGISSFRVTRAGANVQFSIVARSRPGLLLTKILRPLSRRFQRTATMMALEHFRSSL
jgi:uncharacterized protein (UPF0548 family)